MAPPRSQRLINYLRKADLGRDIDRMLRGIEDEIDAAAVVPIIAGNVSPLTNAKNLQSGIPEPLIQVDMTQTISPGFTVADRSFGCKLFFSIEARDDVDAQVRQGDLNAAVCVTTGGTFATAQAANVTNCATSGTTSSTFDWVTAGNLATLRVTAVSSLTTVEFDIHFFLLFATHAAFTYV
jgi:hypothetical protein